VGDVEMAGAVKSFRTRRGRVHAVRGVDLSLALGETVALLGPNGAGKSTSIDLLLGLTRPDRGSVAVLGRTPAEAVRDGLVGAMLQTGMLLRDVSLRELVTMLGSLYPSALGPDEVLELAGVTEFADRPTQKLSGGEAQRARFALALVPDPRLLVLDEPTVGMDVESRRGFWASMRAFADRGRAVLFATHHLDEADAHADRVVMMARGRVVARGTAAELRARVGGRRISATLPGADPRALAALPGVWAAERRGEAVVLACANSDAAIRALLETHPAARDIEISGARLEDAFVQLTDDVHDTAVG
jgi:ABC-2 type transport system ATP-binding protein